MTEEPNIPIRKRTRPSPPPPPEAPRSPACAGDHEVFYTDEDGTRRLAGVIEVHKSGSDYRPVLLLGTGTKVKAWRRLDPCGRCLDAMLALTGAHRKIMVSSREAAKKARPRRARG